MDHLRARPTIYAGIKMRSRLEASFAAILDRYQLQWEYEPMCYASPRGQYLPDFRVHSLFAPYGPECDVRDVPCFIEVKPYVEDERILQRRMEIIWATEPRAELMLVFGDDREMYVAHGYEGDGGAWYHQSPTIWSPSHQPAVELIRAHDLSDGAAARRERARSALWHRDQAQASRAAAAISTPTDSDPIKPIEPQTGAAAARRLLAEKRAAKEKASP